MPNDQSALCRKEIRWFKCCTNGKTITRGSSIPDHMFIILTNEAYNQKANEICGIPLTSEKEKYQHFIINYGLNITDEDIDGFTLEKNTFVLFDRPTRLNKSDLSSRQDNVGKVKDEYLRKLLGNISIFLRTGNKP